MEVMDTIKFYTAPEAARICSVSHATIVRAIENGLLEAATTPGGHYRILRDELELFMKKNKIPLNALEPRSIRVLAVEDNAAQLRFLQKALEADSDFEIRTASSGYEAGYLTKSWRPHVILLDIYLKDMDGRQVAKLVRADPDLKRTKIIALSVIEDPAEIRDVRASGVDDFIHKPVNAAKLKEKIRALV